MSKPTSFTVQMSEQQRAVIVLALQMLQSESIPRAKQAALNSIPITDLLDRSAQETLDFLLDPRFGFPSLPQAVEDDAREFNNGVPRPDLLFGFAL